MQECEKEGGRKSLATVALILSKLLPPHTLTSSHPHHLTPSSPIAHPVSLTASHVHNVPLPPSFHNLPPLTPLHSHHLTPHLIVTFTASHPHHLAHPVTFTASHVHNVPLPPSLHNLPPLTPSPLTPSHHPPPCTPSHHLPPCTPSHCTHAHEQPRYLNRSKMESTVPSCVTCPVEALLHVRSIGYRLPGRMVITINTPNATATTVRARGCEVVQDGLYRRASPPLWSRAHRSSGSGLATRRSLSVTPLASNEFSVSSVAACLLCTGSGYSFDFAHSAGFFNKHFRASLSELRGAA